MTPYTVAVNLPEVARVFVEEWCNEHAMHYGPRMLESWSRFCMFPSAFTLFPEESSLHGHAAGVHELVQYVSRQ